MAFIPSYNPETGCGINATMDIAVAREVLSKLIAACRELQIEREHPEMGGAAGKTAGLSDQAAANWPSGPTAASIRDIGTIRSFTPVSRASIRCSRPTPALRKAAQATVRQRSPAATAAASNRRSAACNAACRRRISAWRRRPTAG